MARESQYLKQRKIRKISRWFSFFLVFLVFCGIGYFFLFARYFLIEKIEAKIDFPEKQALTELTWNQIQNKDIWLIPKNNIFFSRKKTLIRNLAESFPELKNLGWDYDFASQTLFLTGEPREPAIKICQGDGQECFFVDFSGIAFKTNDQSKAEKAFIGLENRSSEEFIPGKEFLPPKMISFAYEFKNQLKDYLELDRIVLEQEFLKAKFFKILTKENWYLLVSFELEPRLIAENLKLMVEKELNGSRSRLEYLDLRYPNKAYYKLR
ncbi:MAG: hypothetical protein AB1721_02555 [Patescibacteria group bacterium]